MAQSSARIVREVLDEPHIEGTRLTVRFIHERVEGLGLDPRTVADRHNLDLADVYHALAYYQAIERERADQIDTHRGRAFTGPNDLE